MSSDNYLKNMKNNEGFTRFKSPIFKYLEDGILKDRRRFELVTLMKDGETNGLNCFSCQGFCCTRPHNSMQVTPLEACELFYYLVKNDMWTEELVTKLEASVSENRLDKEISFGGRSFRRTYTCPFFMHKSLGCPIDPEYKPYGCLAFNPDEKDVSEEGHCSSRVDILEDIAPKHDQIEEDFKKYLKSQGFEFSFQKLPLPVALLELASLLL